MFAPNVMSVRHADGYLPRAARAAGDVWRELAARANAVDCFDPGAVRDQPEVVQRWLGRALAVGVPLGGGVQLRMHGHIRLGEHWRPFEADQVLAPLRGYIWAATARFGRLPVTGFGRFSDGAGEMRWKLLGLVPVVTATGSDVSRSAAGRLAAEIVLAPTAFATADWEATPDPDVACGSFSFSHATERVELRVSADGQVRSASMLRWGNPDRLPFGRHLFGAELSDSETFAGGLTIPTTMRAGWGWGTDRWESGEFFRAKITNAVLLDW